MLKAILRSSGSLVASLALVASLSSQSARVSYDDLAAEANRALGLTRSQVLDVFTPAEVADEVYAVLDVAGSPIFLQLTRHSLRSANFRAVAQRDDGSLEPLPEEPVRTYRGTVVGYPESRVAGSLLEDGLHAWIVLDPSNEYWVQPLGEEFPTAPGTAHVVYQAEHVLPTGETCGTTELLSVGAKATFAGSGSGGGTIGAATNAELGIDTDYEYYQDHGAGTQARVESVINAVNAQYNSEVGISHTISLLIVRSSSNDPYKSKGANRMLSEVMSEWLSQGHGPYDVVQFFSGKTIGGGTIGIAYVGTVCNQTYGFGVVQSDFNGVFSCATDLSAHELGHNWGANHCNCPSNTMNPYITCANTFTNGSRNAITAYLNSQSCF